MANIKYLYTHTPTCKSLFNFTPKCTIKYIESDYTNTTILN